MMTSITNFGTPRRLLEQAFGHALSLEIEPGAIPGCTESGYLVNEIKAVKQMGNNTFYLLDAGVNNLARPILYGSYHPMSIVAIPNSGLPVGRCGTWWWAARCANRETFLRRPTAVLSVPESAARRWGSVGD